ncbi:MAG: chemotaxis protein CheB, partial [Bryobacteraceae bacterium]|nr:chemotaxis protein CheB [Bryobacteraceae bacterium]
MAIENGRRRTGDSPRPKRRTAPAGETPAAIAVDLQPASEECTEGNLPRIVGVGASAGGLDAFTELFSNLPIDTGLAFVVIQHLDPTSPSHLPVLLARACKMPVTEVEDGTRAEANHVYVIPPQFNLSVSGGTLRTTPRPVSGRNMPIDAFLGSLAADQGRKAFGVILSGAGSDGTLGLQAIRDARGATFAQERLTAKFANMPESAIAAGVVDFELAPAGIAQKLAAIDSSAEVSVEPSEVTDHGTEAELKKVFRLLRNATGVDFTFYKHSTLHRRIRRRMVLRGFARLEEYIQELDRNHDEATGLCEDCFITVTAFFREPAVLDELKRSVFPALVDNRKAEDPIRIWVPGCSTGEEAYSLAICLAEFLEEAHLSLPFEIFATDISENAIE